MTYKSLYLTNYEKYFDEKLEKDKNFRTEF
jgi:hypothetical protein